MKVYNLREVPVSRFKDTVFKQSAARKFTGFLLTLGVCAGLIWLGMRGGYRVQGKLVPPFIFFWIGGVMGFIALFILFQARAALRPSNWILKFNKERVLVKFRSHLNSHFPVEDPVLLEFPNSEIEWVRAHRETMSSPDTEGVSKAERLSFWTYLDLKLVHGVDLRAIENLLAAERRRPAPRIGRTRTKHKHYPVKLEDSGVLRLEWNGIRPGIAAALEILGTRFGRKSERKVRAKHWDRLEEREIEDRILDLLEKGRTLEAVALARLKYDCNVTEAKQFVDEILGGRKA